MFLLICALEKRISKEKVEHLIENEKKVEQLTWISGQNGKVKDVRETPMILGSLQAMFKYEEQEVLFAKISGRTNVDIVLDKIKGLEEVKGHLDYYVIPLVA